MSINIRFNDCAFSVLNGRVHLPLTSVSQSLWLVWNHVIKYCIKKKIFDFLYAIAWLMMARSIIKKFSEFVQRSLKKKKSFQICCQIKNCRIKSRYIILRYFHLQFLIWQHIRTDFFLILALDSEMCLYSPKRLSLIDCRHLWEDYETRWNCDCRIQKWLLHNDVSRINEEYIACRLTIWDRYNKEVWRFSIKLSRQIWVDSGEH